MHGDDVLIHLMFVCQVTSFSFNPMSHNLVTAGLFNGRVVYWDTSNESHRIVASMAKEGEDEEAHVAVIRAAYTSAPDMSHKTRVTDLTWLPGLEITRDGKVGGTPFAMWPEGGGSFRGCPEEQRRAQGQVPGDWAVLGAGDLRGEGIGRARVQGRGGGDLLVQGGELLSRAGGMMPMA